MYLMYILKEHYLAEITKLCLLNFLVNDVISPNATKYVTKLDKKVLQKKNRCSSLEKNCGIARMEVDYSSLILIS